MTGSVLLVTVKYKDILIVCLLFPSSPQTHKGSSKVNHHNKDGQEHRSGRRRHHHRREKPLPEPPQSTIQQILRPGNLLRRLLPSSSLFNSGSHTSWTHILLHTKTQARHWVKKKTKQTLTMPSCPTTEQKGEDCINNAVYAARWQALQVENWADNMQINGGKEPQTLQIALCKRRKTKIKEIAYCSGQTCSSVNWFSWEHYEAVTW